MSKAGLCVRYDCDNFGSMLQIYATQKIVKNMGWDYEIIRYDKRTPLFYLTNISRLFNAYFMKGKIETLEKHLRLKRYPIIQKGCDLRNRCIEEFRGKYIGPYSDVYKGYKSLVKGSEKYDAIIVGSDQLWTPAGIKSKFYNLLFVPDDKKKISFATSFGVGEIPKSQRKMTAKYLNRIEHISVREIRGADIVFDLTGRKADVVLDPTLLLSGEDWSAIFPVKQMIDEPYILAYFLGNNEEHRDVVDNLKKTTGLRVVTIPFMDVFVERDLNFGDKKLFNIGPIDFLGLIRNAEYICTDSFHGSVFSILNHKQFITFNRTNDNDKQTRNSRIDSLFSLLSLESRRYEKSKDIKVAIDEVIDYKKVDIILESLRHDTLLFLEQALQV